MNKYKCTICGYIYDSELGDKAHDIESGTTFGDLPDGWRCPLCGAAKKYFEKED